MKQTQARWLPEILYTTHARRPATGISLTSFNQANIAKVWRWPDEPGYR